MQKHKNKNGSRLEKLTKLGIKTPPSALFRAFLETYFNKSSSIYSFYSLFLKYLFYFEIFFRSYIVACMLLRNKYLHSLMEVTSAQHGIEPGNFRYIV